MKYTYAIFALISGATASGTCQTAPPQQGVALYVGDCSGSGPCGPRNKAFILEHNNGYLTIVNSSKSPRMIVEVQQYGYDYEVTDYEQYWINSGDVCTVKIDFAVQGYHSWKA
ncbi:uncharacterized protein EKO05_0001011 [Ascochyta rabiei]|uniref:Uncharacterized protein n=1 Tax=Didymella rabiei TaxID=5454 RepID=A0A162ZEE9_DIDRA|nr:uncharacterized protein EKO05_0001011 [Ascochyta rabiei]KZM20567.1 hypothetical protein ST47_g8289 [Ascochyta rabiei]UPX10347.1 hypothetical protein EKO05_0001011 [Ascochyta rabiei]